MLDQNSSKFLNDSEIREIAPSVFTNQPSSEVSRHYTHVPTNKVINDMRALGWGVADAKEVKQRKSLDGTQKHLVVFRNPDISINRLPKGVTVDYSSYAGYRDSRGRFHKGPDVVFPQILLTNSHDGKNSFQFTAGLFRMICENGLVISTQEFEDIKIRHMGYDFNELEKTLKEMVVKLPLTVETINKLADIEWNEEQILDFANKALEVRFGEQVAKDIEVEMESDFLVPSRIEDAGNDAWSVYNRIQEKIITGDFEYTYHKGKSRKAREIKNFKQDLEINRELFNIAIGAVA